MRLRAAPSVADLMKVFLVLAILPSRVIEFKLRYNCRFGLTYSNRLKERKCTMAAKNENSARYEALRANPSQH